MRLDLLLKREDFSKVFNITLEKYLFNIFQWKGDIELEKGSINSSSKYLIANHKLNIIYPKGINRNILQILAAEYSYHPNIFRRLVQNLYIKVSTSHAFESLFAGSVINVDPWINYFDNVCIVPGNNSIRIIDFKKSQCVVLMKEGFNKKYFNNELLLRNNFPSLPIPKLIKVVESNDYYVEELITGLPWNRIDDEEIKIEALKKAKIALNELYESSYKVILLDEYMNHLLNSLHSAIKNLPAVYNKDDKNKFNLIIEFLKTTIGSNSDKKIQTVQSHGDFQPANIFISSNTTKNIYLIDWEYTERRSIFYDALVFSSKSRAPARLANRLSDIAQNNDNSTWAWCFGKNTSNLKLELWMIGVFLLEDLLVKLVELQIPDLISHNDGLNIWEKEVRSMGWLAND